MPVGIPVIAGAADKACEVLGVGALEAGVASVSCGTTATINTTRSQYVEVVPFMPAYPAALPEHFNTEIQVFRGFWMVSWFLEQFGEAERSDGLQSAVSRRKHCSTNYWRRLNPARAAWCCSPSGTRFLGETGPEGRGSIIGFKDFHTRAHVYRALIEGLAFALRSGKERIERRTKTPIYVYSPLWRWCTE